VTINDISAKRADFSMKFHRTVKQENFTTKFCWSTSESDKIMLFQLTLLIFQRSVGQVCCWLWKEPACWWWDEDAEFEMQSIFNTATGW